jgi:hypothetical protein
LGFAYRPFKDDRTVVRAGYGLFFDTSQDNEWADATGFYPFYVSSTQIASYGLNLIQTNNLFPALPAATVTPATMPFELVDTHMLNPYVQSIAAVVAPLEILTMMATWTSSSSI